MTNAYMQEGLDAFKSGQVAMQMNWFASSPASTRKWARTRSDSSSTRRAASTTRSSAGRVFPVVAYSERKDDALQYLKWFAQPDVQKKWWALGGYSCLKAVLEDPNFTKSAPFAGIFSHR
jgi:multiple sugar transport system substrate-binding protein